MQVLITNATVKGLQCSIPLPAGRSLPPCLTFPLRIHSLHNPISLHQGFNLSGLTGARHFRQSTLYRTPAYQSDEVADLPSWYPGMDFSQLEEADGIRMTWNIWPTSKVEVRPINQCCTVPVFTSSFMQATKCVIPFAAIYTPTKRLPSMPVRHLMDASV